MPCPARKTERETHICLLESKTISCGSYARRVTASCPGTDAVLLKSYSVGYGDPAECSLTPTTT